MKKNFVQKLALGLALVMTVTSVPVSSEAAAKPAFKSATLSVEEGATAKAVIKGTKKWEVKKVVSKDGTVATIAKVAQKAKKVNVKVTGVKAGETTVVATLKKADAKVKAKLAVTVTAKQEEAPVVVAPELASVKQTAANAFEATFTADAREKVTVASFTEIKSQGAGYTATVDTLTWSADGKTAYVTTFGNFIDKAVYDVTCNDKTASFTAVIGEVASIVVDTVNAKSGVPTDIKFRLFDTNGIDVTNVVALDTNVIVSVTGDYSYVETSRASEATITMATVGDTAEVIVTYSKFDGTVDVVSKPTTITCVDNAVVVGAKEYFTLKPTGIPKFYLDSYKANTTVYMDEPAIAYFLATDAQGNGIAYDAYEVETSNEAVLEVSESTFDVDGKVLRFTVEPVAKGTAQITIKATKNGKTYTYTKAVTVQEAKVAKTIILGQSSVSISENQTTWVDAYVLDQYNNPMFGTVIDAKDVTNSNPDDDVVVENMYDSYHMALGIKGVADIDGDGYGDVDSAKFSKIGNHVIELNASDIYGNEVTKKFTVNVKNIPEATTNNVDYKLVVSSKTIDLDPEKNCASCFAMGLYEGTGETALDELAVGVRLAKYTGGVFTEYVTTVGTSDVTIEVKKGSKVYGKTLTTSGSALTLADDNNTVDGKGIVFSAVDTTDLAIDMHDEMAAIGTYNVTAKYDLANGKQVKKSATFKVVNGMEMPTVKAISTIATDAISIKDECLLTDVSVGLNGNDAIIDYGYYNASRDTFTGVVADGLDFDGNGRLLINRVLVTDTFNGVTYTYYVPFTRTFKLN